MPKSKASLDEAELADLLSLKDSVKANNDATTEIRGELTTMKHDLGIIGANQTSFTMVLGTMQATMSDLSSQVHSMATILQSLRPVGPSRSQPPAAQHEQTDHAEQRSPTLQQQLQTRQPTQGNTQAERAADIERRILLDKELVQRAVQLPQKTGGGI
jgi:hypothetical protein